MALFHHGESPERVLAVPSRRRLYEYVEHNQGVHQRALARGTHLSVGTTLYHMERLEGCGLVVARHDGRYKRYFAGNALDMADKSILVALRRTVPRQIVVALLERHAATQREIFELIGVSRSTASLELLHLIERHIVTRETRRPESIYTLIDPELAARVVQAHGASLGIGAPVPAASVVDPVAHVGIPLLRASLGGA